MGRQPQYNGASSRFEFTSSGFETGRLESYLRYPFVEVSVSPTLHGSDGPLRSNIQCIEFFRRKNGFSVVGGWGL